MPQYRLTHVQVRRAAAVYYDAGKLTAQHPEPSRRRAAYFTADGYRCPVGAALPKRSATAGLILSGTVLGQPLLKISAEDFPKVRQIQRAHDAWARAAAAEAGTTDELQNDFLALIAPCLTVKEFASELVRLGQQQERLLDALASISESLRKIAVKAEGSLKDDLLNVRVDAVDAIAEARRD